MPLLQAQDKTGQIICYNSGQITCSLQTLRQTLQRQYEMNIKVGSGRPLRAFADFVGFRDPSETDVLMVIESKRRIRSDMELLQAVEQCESYAGKLRCTRFAVASPEGIWVYDLHFPTQSKLIAEIKSPTKTTVINLDEEIKLALGFAQLSNMESKGATPN